MQKDFFDSNRFITVAFFALFSDFCGFHKVPDAPLLTRFKQKFLPYLEILFKHLVDLTESICQAVDPSLAQMLIFDTSDSYKIAYGLMPTHAKASENVFKTAHPEIAIAKKSGAPDMDKSIEYPSALKPVLQDYATLHPMFKPDVFIGDAAFDSIETHGFLQNKLSFFKGAYRL